MSGFNSSRLFQLLGALLVGATLIVAAASSAGSRIASAQSVVFPTCADNSVLYPGEVCGNVGFALCPGGGASVAGAPCPFLPNGPYPQQTTTYAAGIPAACLAGIGVTATGGCVGSYVPSTYNTPTGGPPILPGGSLSIGVSGQYCTLASGGGQVWVPAGASPADMGC